MKKILSLIIACLFVVSISNGQALQMTGGYVTGDTVVNTASKACSTKVVKSYKSITIQANVTKISGTVGGAITLQGSVDGVNFVTADTAAFVSDGPATYTATNSASQSKVWVINGSPYVWWKVSYTGTGTMSAILKGYILPRENQ
jgi:hypothetical protein